MASPPREGHRRLGKPHQGKAAINGPRDLQPGVPITIQDIIAEGIAAAESGAAIIYLHAYDETTGRIQEGLRLALQHKLHPSFAIYEPGFARLGGHITSATIGADAN
jgi:hypothetical protein